MKRRSFLKAAAAMATAPYWPSQADAAGAGKSAIVIGAGMAGLSAARLLTDSGFETTVIEARTRLGGRIHTRRDFSSAVDLGANWIHGIEGNPLTPLAKKYGSDIRFSNFNAVHGFFADGRAVPSARALLLFAAALSALQKPAEAGSSVGGRIRDALAGQMKTPDDRLIVNAIVGTLMLEAGGTELDKADLVEFQATGDFDGGDYRFVNGTDSIVYGLARGLSIRTGVPVKRIRLKDRGIEVEAEHESYTADYVIVAVPLGVLKQHSITFEPELPKEKTEAIARLGVGLSEQVVLKFPKAFWPEKPTVLVRATESKTDFPTFFNNHLPFTGDAILTARVAGSQVTEFNRLSDEEAQSRVMAVLRKAFGSAVSEPTGMLRSKWADDPFSAGAYSSFDLNVPSRKLRTEFGKPHKDRLFFAGEHSHPDYPATVHGAHLSGVRAAEQILASV